MMDRVSSHTNVSYLCGCSYDSNRKLIDGSCGYTVRDAVTSTGNINVRATRVEADHIVPASVMGSGLKCWSPGRASIAQCRSDKGRALGGRECCMRTNDVFNTAHNDIVNLVPIVGELNAMKSANLSLGVAGEPRNYGTCDVELTNDTWEPPAHLEGDVSRIELYMLRTYGKALGFTYTDAHMDLIRARVERDPVSKAESIRLADICTLQGYPCKVLIEEVD